MRRIVITGGHHNAALVVALLLTKQGIQVEWIGHRHSSRGDQLDSAEYLEVTASGLSFHDLTAARLIFNLREIILAPLGLVRALYLLRTLRPDAILSFGGYLGGTVSLAASVLGLPIYLHEQTSSAGRANKLIGRLAKRIYLTWADSARYFPAVKTKMVGLPLRPSLLSPTRKSFFARHKLTLIVMGGKLGAHCLNQFIFTHLTELLSHVNIIHQTGTNSVTGDYVHAVSLQNSLGSLSDCYLPVGYIAESEIGTYLKSADYYFGRSGAHICYELGLLGLPAILTPLTITHDQEQFRNARILVKAGLGIILAESSLTLPHFVTELKALADLPPAPLKLPKTAGSTLVRDFVSNLYGT